MNLILENFLFSIWGFGRKRSALGEQFASEVLLARNGVHLKC